MIENKEKEGNGIHATSKWKEMYWMGAVTSKRAVWGREQERTNKNRAYMKMLSGTPILFFKLIKDHFK